MTEPDEVLFQLQLKTDIARTEMKVDENGTIWFKPPADVIKRYHLEHLVKGALK